VFDPGKTPKTMIVYNLACENNHKFEGWFGSASVYEEQHSAGAVECPVCGSNSVTRMPAGSHVNTSSQKEQVSHPVAAGEGMAARIQKKVLEYIYRHTEDVGANFPEEARKIFYNEVAKKNIRGTASNEEVVELREEGIDVYVIPSLPELPDKLH
jgi:hypothetical protein